MNHKILLILLLILFNSCEKFATKSEPQQVIIGRWQTIEVGNGSNMERIEDPNGYSEYFEDSLKIEYSQDLGEYRKRYWIDSLLYEYVYLQNEQRRFMTGIYSYTFFDNNKKMKLVIKGPALYTTTIDRRIK
jgi:hypothetical protein